MSDCIVLYCSRAYVVVLPDWVDDGDVTVECHQQDAVSRSKQTREERHSCLPDATDELIVG